MPASLIEYRLSIKVASTTGTPNPTTDELVVTSVPSGTNPYIAEPPSGDGQEVDPITGAIRSGAYTVQIVDANTGTDATGTIRVLTNKLEDATFRQQLISRRAIVETRTDGGAWQILVSGFIAGVRLVSPMRYEVTVGDSRRVEQTQTIFQGAALGTFTTRGCFLGGPLTANWGPIRARGGWQYVLTNVGTNLWRASFVRGYASTPDGSVSTDWRKILHPNAVQIVATYVRQNPYPSTGASVTYDFAFAGIGANNAVTDGVVAYIGNTQANAVLTNAVLVESSEAYDSIDEGVLVFYWPSCPYASGTTVFISLTTATTTDDCPLYLDAHPVDIATAIWDNARIQWNAAAAVSVKALIGDNVRLACRFPQPPTIAEFLEKAIFGPFGVSARTNSAGEQELFATRIRTSTTPSITLGTNALRSAEPLVFDLDEQTAVSTITLRQQYFQPAQNNWTYTQTGRVPSDRESLPFDGVDRQTVEQTSQYLDPNLTVFTGRNVTYDVPGMIHTAADWTPATTPQLDAISLAIFDRFGRGCQASEAQVLAGTAAAAAQVGDELYYDVAHFPNKGYRIGESSVGARIMQVVRRTETPSGPVLRLLDSGLAAQPATLPTITIAQNPNAPSSVARFTITNAATLNAGGVISVRVEWATGATTPTAGADFATYAPAAIPTSAVDLPAVTTPGTVVWVRARSEQAGRRPSAWSAWTSVTLASIAAPSSLTTSNLRQTAVTLSWSNTSSTLPLAVFAFQGASAPASWLPYRVGTLPVGSTSTVVRSLTGPSVAWTLGVAYETPNGLGTFATATVTTNSTLDTTTRPAGVAVIPGVDDATLTQGVALALWPSDPTLDIVIERSTTSGSGFAEIARVAGSTAVYVDQRPRDGVTYYYRIAHALGGFALTSYTPEASAVARGVPSGLVRPDAVIPVVQVETTESGTTGTVTLTITDPQGRTSQVRFRERTGGGAWSAWTVDSTVPYSYSGTIPTSGFLDIQYEVNGFRADGSVGLIASGTESFDVGSTADMVSVVGSFNASGVMTLAVSADSDTASIKVAISSISQPDLATTQAQSPINSRNYSTTTGPYASNTTVYVSVLGYTGLNGTGTESVLFQYRFTRDGALVYTECLASLSSATATQITVTVTGTAPSGTPTVQLVAVTGSATLASGAAIGTPVASGSTWVFNRGAALGPPGGAQFRAVLAGAQSDDDFIEIPEQGRDTTYLTTRARVISTSDTQVVARYAVLDKYSALTSTIGYVATGVPTVTPASGGTVTTAVGDTFTSPEVAGSYIDYTITRPAFQAGTGRVTFTATATGRVADSDAVDIPAQERDTTYLSARARVTATTATQATVRVAVLDKYNALTSTIAYVAQGTGTVTPGSGGTVTAAVGDTYASPNETAGSFIDYTIDRPAFGAGTGRVTFTVTAAGRVAATDAVDIPAIERDTIALTSRARIFSQTATQMVVRYAVATPVALSPNTASIAYVTEGLASVTPGSPQTITPETNTQVTEAAGSFVDFTIGRPSVGSNPGRIAFQGTATGRTSTSDSVDIPPQERVGPSLKIVTTPGATSYTLQLTWDGTIAYALDGVTQSVAGWTSPRTEVINRNDYLTSPKVASFSVLKDGITISETVNIPAKDTSGASLTIGTQNANSTTNVYTFTWTATGFPTGTTYDLIYTTTTTAGVVEQGVLNNQTSPVNVTSGFSIGANPKYQMTVNAILNGTLILTKSRAGTFLT